jgi:hypothetical protein
VEAVSRIGRASSGGVADRNTAGRQTDRRAGGGVERGSAVNNAAAGGVADDPTLESGRTDECLSDRCDAMTSPTDRPKVSHDPFVVSPRRQGLSTRRRGAV